MEKFCIVCSAYGANQHPINYKDDYTRERLSDKIDQIRYESNSYKRGSTICTLCRDILVKIHDLEQEFLKRLDKSHFYKNVDYPPIQDKSEDEGGSKVEKSENTREQKDEIKVKNETVDIPNDKEDEAEFGEESKVKMQENTSEKKDDKQVENMEKIKEDSDSTKEDESKVENEETFREDSDFEESKNNTVENEWMDLKDETEAEEESMFKMLENTGEQENDNKVENMEKIKEERDSTKEDESEVENEESLREESKVKMLKNTSEKKDENKIKNREMAKQVKKPPTKHRQRSTIEDFTCFFCGKIFTKSYNLNLHQRSHYKDHMDEKPFMCKVCKRPFLTESGLNRHACKKETFRCKRCHKDCATDSQLKNHKCKNYTCKICKEEFLEVKDYQSHMETHRRENRFVCRDMHPGIDGPELCEKAYRTKQGLDKHKMGYDPKWNRKCDGCKCMINIKLNGGRHLCFGGKEW